MAKTKRSWQERDAYLLATLPPGERDALILAVTNNMAEGFVPKRGDIELLIARGRGDISFEQMLREVESQFGNSRELRPGDLGD